MPGQEGSVGAMNIDVDEQKRIFERIEQERADLEMATRLQNELYNVTPVATPQRNRPTASAGNRSSNRASWVPSSGSRRGRGAAASSSARGNHTRRNQPNGNGGGPIRRVASRGHRAAAPNSRNRAARNNTDGAQLTFRGDRVVARQGNQSVDVTANVYFPDDDEDHDYDGEDEDDEVDSDDSGESSADSSSDDSDVQVMEQEDSPRPNPTPAARRGGMAARRGGVPRGRGGRGRQPAPSISRNYIHMLVDNVYRNRHVVDIPSEDDEDYEGGESDGENNNLSGSDVSDEEDDSDQSGDEDGPLRRDENHIQQEIFAEDLEMYDRELGLWHNDDEYTVPPPQEQLQPNGKPIEPDSTWGDCTMCLNPPVKPQGCAKCLQILGCADCVHRWYVARVGSEDGPSCPLCRNEWKTRPGVLLMKTITRRMQKEKEERKEGPSTSTRSSASSSK